LKRITIKLVLMAMVVIWSMNSMAAGEGKPAFVPSNKVQPTSKRLIVKFRVSKTDQVMSAQQIYAELSRPLATDVIRQLETAAGTQLKDLRATGTGAHVMTLAGAPGTQTVAQAVAGISKLPNVEYAEEDYIETIQLVPSDAYYTTGPGGNPGLWGMRPLTAVTGQAPSGTGSYGANFQAAWDLSTGVGVVVAVVDTGITAHPDIVGPSGLIDAGADSNLVSSGYDFITDCRMRGDTAVGGCPASTVDGLAYIAPVAGAADTGDYVDASDTAANSALFPASSQGNSSWHGTHVAGTIAAIGNNSIGVIGGAFGAKILPVRVLGKGGGMSADVSDGIMWAAGVHPTIPNPNPARVINLSLGSTRSCSATANRQAAITAAVNAGAVVIVAAGNDNQDVANSSSANCNNVISVAAIARDGSRAGYSNFSSPASNTTNPVQITLAAQGGDQYYPASFDPGILSTLDTGTTTPVGSTYDYYVGTSMATPHVSAAVALMLSYNPNLSPARVKEIFSTSYAMTAFPSFVSGWATWDCSKNHNCGTGILNAYRALQNSTTTAQPPADFTPSGPDGGGGCAIMPFGATPDVSLLLAMLAVGVYWLRRRIVRTRSAD
jgi:serine protease